MSKTFATIISALVLLLASFFAGRLTAKPEEVEVVKETRDTLYLRDTLRVEVAAAPCYITKTETVYVPVEKVVTVHDTTVVEMERQTLRYEDSTYTAVVSGIDPRLDSLSIYPQKEIVTIHTTERIKPSRWGIGATAGYGVAYAGGALHPAPFVGIGVTYNILTF